MRPAINGCEIMADNGAKNAQRDARLAKALRANLKRRKAQSRSLARSLARTRDDEGTTDEPAEIDDVKEEGKSE